MAVGIFGLAVVAQVILALYRGRIQQIPANVGLGVALLLALPLALELGRENRFIRLVARTLGVLLVLLGSASMLFPHPVGGLLLIASVPVFLVSSGVLLLVARSWWKWRMVLLILFLFSFAGLEAIVTIEAHHARDRKEEGVTAVWH